MTFVTPVTSNTRAWISYAPDGAGPAARTLLFCAPFAGGGAATFRTWGPKLAPAGVHVYGARLPGRESRLRDPPLASVAAVVGALAGELRGLVQQHAQTGSDARVALFGHSFGSLVAYELAHALAATPVPVARLFVGGRPAPDQPQRLAPIHHLDDDAFAEGLVRYGGTPAAILDDPELRAAYLPALRADFTALETYACPAGAARAPLAVPLTVVNGADDALAPPDSAAAWGRHTSGPLDAHTVPGGHFFLKASEDALLDVVRARLTTTP